MQTIRSTLRWHRSSDISVPQFRTMGYIDVNEGASRSELANHIGLTLPSMLKLIDRLVGRKLVTHTAHSRDQRRICLSLTPLDREELRAAHRCTERFLAGKLSGLGEVDLAAIVQPMQVLRELFAGDIRGSVATRNDE